MDKDKCLHCGEGEPGYCEDCYQKLIAENVRLQTLVEKMAKFMEVNEVDSLFCKEYCEGTIRNCKYPNEDGCVRCIIEYFEKKVKENESND